MSSAVHAPEPEQWFRFYSNKMVGDHDFDITLDRFGRIGLRLFPEGPAVRTWECFHFFIITYELASSWVVEVNVKVMVAFPNEYVGGIIGKGRCPSF